MVRKAAVVLVLVLGVVGLTSCSNGTTPPGGGGGGGGGGTVTVTVAPGSANVRIGATQQFTATVTGSTNTAVTWDVNGTQNGNATVGTISNAGLYTPPAVIPAGTITVRATSAAQTTATSTATASIWNPMPVV